MTKAKDIYTLDMFEIPQADAPIPSSMDYRKEVSSLVGMALKDTDLDRHDLAASMSRLSGHDVSKYMLDAWASESRENYNIPFYQVAVLETAAHTHLFTNWLAKKRGGQLLVGKETLNAELGKLERLKEEANRKIKEVKKVMGEMG